MKSCTLYIGLLLLAGCAPKQAAMLEAGDASPSAIFAEPNDAFLAIEPSVLGVVAAPTVWDVLAPVGRRAPEGLEGDQASEVRIRKGGDGVIADIIQSGLLDDAASAEHVRLELRLEPDGWFVTNAYIRQKCRRGALAGAWTNEPCP